MFGAHKKLKYIDALESVQQRTTKILPRLRKYSYTERLNKLKLPTSTYQRARGDMIETYRMVHDIYNKVSCLKITVFYIWSQKRT